ncbi:prepilin-type N-terminal cleavage/methylation domain-containing protein [Candidatus Saccharibacteria bacterium]|nr:prepilin-type N-terminal cleavage/methylation domain-containing protein [Candidatus Saccharibacteria bacterium]
MVSSQKNKSKGFTIVELLIVIIVIGILATLVIALFTSAKKKARDSQRQTDVVALQGYIEGFYAEEGKYPTLANINDSTWRGTHMEGLDPAALADPKNATSQSLVGVATANSYLYTTTPADCDNGSGGDCTGYSLTATLEGNPGTFKKSSN